MPKSGKRKKGLCFGVFVYFLTINNIMMLASERSSNEEVGVILCGDSDAVTFL